MKKFSGNDFLNKYHKETITILVSIWFIAIFFLWSMTNPAIPGINRLYNSMGFIQEVHVFIANFFYRPYVY